jgi:signal transduction histidine kinase
VAGTPVTVHGHTLALLYLADNEDGSPLADEEAAVVRALARVAGYVLAHARSRAVAERRRVWQNHAAALSSALQPPFDFSSVDRAVTDVALRAAGGVASTIARLADGELVVTAISGAAPAWISEDEHEAAVHAVLDGASGEAEAGQDHLVLLASMNTHLSPAGALAIYFPADRPPEDFEMDLLGEFAEQAALALDRARAFRDREHMTLVGDRDRIARELHDAVIQRLFAAGLHLQKSRAMATDAELRERLAVSIHDLDQTVRAIRESIFDLQGGHPRVRGQQGGGPA